jgi:hypothetical protein
MQVPNKTEDLAEFLPHIVMFNIFTRAVSGSAVAMLLVLYVYALYMSSCGGPLICVLSCLVMLIIHLVSSLIADRAKAAVKQYCPHPQQHNTPSDGALPFQPLSGDAVRLWKLLHAMSTVLLIATIAMTIVTFGWYWCLLSTTSAAPPTPLVSAVNTTLTAANASHSTFPDSGMAPANTTTITTTPLSALQDRLSALETTVSGIVKNSTGAALGDDALYTPHALAVIRIMRCAKVAVRGWADRAAKGLGYQPISPP